MISMSRCRKEKLSPFFFEEPSTSLAVNKNSAVRFQKILWEPLPVQTPGCFWASFEINNSCDDELTCWFKDHTVRPDEPSTTQKPEQINARCRTEAGTLCNVQREVWIVKPCPTPPPPPPPPPTHYVPPTFTGT